MQVGAHVPDYRPQLLTLYSRGPRGAALLSGEEHHMTYFESAEGIKVTKARAMVELRRHAAENDWPEFIADMGDLPEYDAQAVLAWLGY